VCARGSVGAGHKCRLGCWLEPGQLANLLVGATTLLRDRHATSIVWEESTVRFHKVLIIARNPFPRMTRGEELLR
jgi:hypothetical protein